MSERPARHAWRAALIISLALHALGFLAVRDVLRLPKVDLEFELPSEAEFGVVEESEPPPAPAAPTTQQQPANEPAESEAKPEPRSAPQPSEPKRPKRPPSKPEPPLPAALAAAGGVADYAPKGTQLALRLDLERIRQSPLTDDANALLRAIPDVRALLDGSGVDPVHDLSRLFLASPDLRREHVVMAGRYLGDEDVPRAAVARLAQQSGQTAEWQMRRGFPTAPWHNSDVTARVVALIGPGVFAITRPDDLPRILAVARASRSRKPADADTADDLVSMAERELLNFSVENARSFVRGARAQLAPDRLALSIRQDAAEPGLLHLTSAAHYPDANQAQTALEYWENLRDRYAGHPLVALMNLDGLLRDLKLTRVKAELTARVVVPPRQARLLLRFARDSVRGPEPIDPAGSETSAPP